jgi:glutamine cyclotransferase
MAPLLMLTLILASCGSTAPAQIAVPAPLPATAAALATSPPTALPAPAAATAVDLATAYPAPAATLPAYPPARPSDAPTEPPTLAPTEAPATPTPASAPPVALCVPPEQIATSAQPRPTPAAPGTRTAPAPVPTFTYRIVNIYPHDPSAFTEGLQYVDGQLYESTGLNGHSELRRVDLASGAVQQRCALPEQAFGEGITVLGGMIYQLTWQNGTGMLYDKGSFQLLRTFSYAGEGWGMTTDGQQLIMSDGTPTLRWLDPATLQETAHVDVYDDNGPVAKLNELEYVDGAILANVWQTDRIAQIDPASGAVTAWIDLSGLLSAADRAQPVDVLNGIAYDSAGKRLFVTGKYWPKVFEIALVPAQ